MTALWGNRWCGHFSDPKIGATAAKLWQDSLSDIPPATIVATIKKMARTTKYAPTIAEIREVALNIISADAAFAEASAWRHNKELKCSNRAVTKAAEAVISWDWSNLPPKELKDAYKAQYNKFVDEMMGGDS